MPKKTIKVSKKAEEAILGRIQQDFDFAQGERNKHVTDWEKARYQYNSKWYALTKTPSDENLDQWIYVPKTYMTVSRIEASFLQHFFPVQPQRLCEVTSTLDSDTAGLGAALLDDILQAKVDNELQPRNPFLDAWRTGLIEGVGVLKGGWDKTHTVQADGALSTRNAPELEFIPNENVMWDPYATTVDRISFFIHERWLTEDELWARHAAGIYKYVPEMLDMKADEGREDPWRQEIAGPGNTVRRLYKIVEYWGALQLLSTEELDKLHKKKKPEHKHPVDVVATVYRNKFLLRVDPNPYAKLYERPTPYEKLPFWLTIPLSKTNSTYGDSLVLRMRPLQREINMLRNQRRQVVEKALQGKIFFDQNRLTDLKGLDSARFMGRVPTDGPPKEIVHEFTPQGSSMGLRDEEGVMDEDMRDVTGVTQYHMAGTAPGMQKTATGVQIVTAEGNVKLDTLLQNVTLSGVVPVLQFMANAALEYMEPKDIADVIGATPPVPLKTILRHDFQIEIAAGGSATSKATELQNIQFALSSYAQIAQAAPQVAVPAMMQLTERLMKLLHLKEVPGMQGAAQPQPQEQAPQGAQMQQLPLGRTPTVQEMPRG